MANEIKKSRIEIRIEKSQKEKWKNLCQKQKISLSELIINSVENKMMSAERRKVIAFIEKQDNIFAKIENNINQFAKIANTQKQISEMEMKIFNRYLEVIEELRKKQIHIFRQIFDLISRDDS